MPQIKEYTAEATSLRPTETGIDALAQVGRRAAGFFNQAAEAMKGGAEAQARAAGAVATADENVARSVAGIAKSVDEAAKQADDFVTHQEISHGAASFSQLHSDLLDAWDNTTKGSDPNDTSIAGKFRETQLEPSLEQFTGSFHTTRGQQWAESHAMALRDHMAEKQSADMANMAGDAVLANVKRLENTTTNIARKDPSIHNIDFLLEKNAHDLDGIIGTSPTLKGTMAAKIRNESLLNLNAQTVKAAALGAIEKAPGTDAWKRYADRYPGLINSQEMSQFEAFAKANQRAESADSERARRLQKEQEIDKSAKLRDEKYIPDITGDNPQATHKQILNDHSLTWEDRQRLLGVINKENKTTVDDSDVKRDIGATLHDPSKSLSDVRATIMQAEIDGKLTPQTGNIMRQLSQEIESGPIKEPIYAKTMVDVAKKIGVDEVGKEHFANFQLDFMSQYLAAKRAGNAPPNALDTNDPKSMISQAMKPYMRDAMTRAKDAAQSKAGFGGINLDELGPSKAAPAKPEPAGVPAIKDREVGKSYPTPMGLMRWTGTGWVRV